MHWNQALDSNPRKEMALKGFSKMKNALGEPVVNGV